LSLVFSYVKIQQFEILNTQEIDKQKESWLYTALVERTSKLLSVAGGEMNNFTSYFTL